MVNELGPFVQISLCSVSKYEFTIDAKLMVDTLLPIIEAFNPETRYMRVMPPSQTVDTDDDHATFIEPSGFSLRHGLMNYQMARDALSKKRNSDGFWYQIVAETENKYIVMFDIREPIIHCDVGPGHQGADHSHSKKRARMT